MQLGRVRNLKSENKEGTEEDYKKLCHWDDTHCDGILSNLKHYVTLLMS